VISQIGSVSICVVIFLLSHIYWTADIKIHVMMYLFSNIKVMLTFMMKCLSVYVDWYLGKCYEEFSGMGTVIKWNWCARCMNSMLGCARTHVFVPKPVEFELLVWRLATDMLPLSDKPQTVRSLDEWRLVAGDYR